MQPSKSPQRMTFQRDAYIERCREEGKEPEQAYLDMYEQMMLGTELFGVNPKDREHNLEWDLRTTPWILDKARASDSYAQNIYSALCNQQWISRDIWHQLKEQTWSCSWRHAGGIVADMLGRGDYIDWYCSGMGGLNQDYDSKETIEDWSKRTGYVPEGLITEEILTDFNRLGWTNKPYDDNQ